MCNDNVRVLHIIIKSFCGDPFAHIGLLYYRSQVVFVVFVLLLLLVVVVVILLLLQRIYDSFLGCRDISPGVGFCDTQAGAGIGYSTILVVGFYGILKICCALYVLYPGGDRSKEP